MLWFDGVLRSYGVFVDSRRSVPSCRPTETTSGAAATASESRASGSCRVGRVECARAAARVGASGPSQPHATIPAKEPAVRPRRSEGFGTRFGASEAPSSGARRVVSLRSHRDRLRTAGAPQRSAALADSRPRSRPQLHQFEPKKRLLTHSFAHCWSSPALRRSN